MSGPSYPPGPLPGSNAFGLFSFGVSPFGTIPSFDPWTTIISQYANSPAITSIILAFNAAMDQTENLDNFYDFMWNVETAQGYGLDVWGRIVGVSRTLELQAGKFFGFEQAVGEFIAGFSQGAPFFSGTTVNNNYVLSDDDYRTLILAKAFANICDGSITSLNKLALSLFPGQGNAYVTNGQDMSIAYNFEFALSPVQEAIVLNSGVLPVPGGMAVTYNYPGS